MQHTSHLVFGLSVFVINKTVGGSRLSNRNCYYSRYCHRQHNISRGTGSMCPWWLSLGLIHRHHIMWVNSVPERVILGSDTGIVPNPTMHHIVTEMCTYVHISVTKWCIVGYFVWRIVGFVRWVYNYITVTSHERKGFSNHRQFDCLLNSLSRLTVQKTPEVHFAGTLRRESTGDR